MKLYKGKQKFFFLEKLPNVIINPLLFECFKQSISQRILSNSNRKLFFALGISLGFFNRGFSASEDSTLHFMPSRFLNNIASNSCINCKNAPKQGKAGYQGLHGPIGPTGSNTESGHIGF